MDTPLEGSFSEPVKYRISTTVSGQYSFFVLLRNLPDFRDHNLCDEGNNFLAHFYIPVSVKIKD